MILTAVVANATAPLYLLYIGLGILAAAGAIGGIFAYFRGGLAKSTIDLLQVANGELRAEATESTLKITRLESAIHQLEIEVSTLTKAVAQTKTFEKLDAAAQRRQETIERQLNLIIAHQSGGNHA